MFVRILICAGMGAARLVELAYSSRNLRERGGEESPRSRTVYPFIVAVHMLCILGTLLRGKNVRSPFWLLSLIAVQPLRIWVLRTLGSRWNTRGAVPQDMEIETGGPYRFVRHPNYVVVVIELAALPLAFGLRGLGAFVSLANAILLAARIADEERALLRVPGYREYMASRPRFIPGLF